MCCFITTLFLLGPRAAVLIWWLINPLWLSLAFDNRFIWPVLGLIFAPWTTLMYLIVWSPATGIYGLDWAFIGLGILADIGTYAGGGYGNRDRIPGYSQY